MQISAFLTLKEYNLAQKSARPFVYQFSGGGFEFSLNFAWLKKFKALLI
jgi:hypothetical protein